MIEHGEFYLKEDDIDEVVDYDNLDPLYDEEPEDDCGISYPPVTGEAFMVRRTLTTGVVPEPHQRETIFHTCYFINGKVMQGLAASSRSRR